MKLTSLLSRRRSAAAAVVAGVVVLLVAAAAAGLLPAAVAAVGVVALPVVAALVMIGRRLQRLQSQGRTLFHQNRAVLAETQAVLAGLQEATKAVDRVERAERRILAAVETERLAAADRHRRITNTAVDSRKLADTLLIQNHQQTREIEALFQLYRDFQPRSAMPPSGRWALNPSDLLAVLGHLERRRPALVVELGSGSSTVWIAYALQRLGGRLVSIDHDPVFGAQTRGQLAAHSLTDVAEVRDAPLRRVTVDDELYQWFDTAALEDLRDIEVLLVDGPPKTVGPLARFPAVPLLADRLADEAVVLLDDAGRPDEQVALERWLTRVPGLTRRQTLLGQHAELVFHRPAATAPDQRRGRVAAI